MEMNMGGTLRETIKQVRPFRSVQAESFISLLLTVDGVREIALRPLMGYGLSAEQYNVLRILRGARKVGLPTYKVVERMVSRAPNITRLVNKLVAKNLARRIRSDTDHRVTTLQITPEGLRVLEELDGPMDRSTERAMGGLSQAELGTLLRLLEKLRQPLERLTNTPTGRSDGPEGGEKEEERRKR